MKNIASTAAVICAVTIGVSLISLIIPSGSTKRVINTVIGVFILCCMIAPVKNAVENFNPNIEIPELKNNISASADEAYNNAVVIETENKLSNMVASYLKSKNIKIKSAKVRLQADNKKGIFIESIRIYINRRDVTDYGNINSLIENKFEKTPEIKVT